MQKMIFVFSICLIVLCGKAGIVMLSPAANEYEIWPQEGALRWNIDMETSTLVDVDVCVYYYDDNGRPFYKMWTPLKGTDVSSIHIPSVACGYYNGAYYELPIKSVACLNMSNWSPFRNLESVSLSEGVERIDGAFHGCDKLTAINLPSTLKSIGYYSFGGCCRLNSIVLPNSLQEIGERAFYSCTNLVGVVIPDSVVAVGNAAFSYCSALKEMILPNKRNIDWGENVFRYCNVLESVNVAGEITGMPEGMFANCTNLKVVAFSQLHPPESLVRGFSSDYLGRLYYPSDYADEWVEALGLMARCGKSWAALDENDIGYIEVDDIRVPYSWIGKYRLTSGGATPLSAVGSLTGKKDSSGRALTVMDDYIAGTDPTNENSRFKAIINMSGGFPSISYEPDLNKNGLVRIYTIYGKAEIKDNWTSPINSTHRFFKVEVAMP